MLAGGCGKSPEAERAAAVAAQAQATGRLLVQSNRPDASVEATHLTATGDAATAGISGPVNRELTGLPPGHYAVVVRSEGWPQLAGAVDVVAGRTTEVVMNFKSGALHLESEPSGATVKLGPAVLGQTPLLLLELPVGESKLTLEYPAWPTLIFPITITENVEATATARLPHGKLIIETIPAGAAVQLDGKAIGQTPLTLAEVPVGPKKIRLSAPNFPTLVAAVTVEDRGEAKINLALASGLPLLDPAALLRAVWVPDNPGRLTSSFDATGRYAPKNGVVKNLNRQKLHDNWLDQRYRYTGTVKSYDAKTAEIEFTDDKGELSRYRVVAQLTPGARADKTSNAVPAKGATVTVYGQLQRVEEPRWPLRVITLELTLAEILPVAAP
ncbi:PEGA domain protein [Lacunisphaera limnophila]|uniref:PEGA domain protein n=1 Tax=Lacunisphaera limnophila TaxID=1838286 RepID=A0A1D8AUM4_9BACT|nr:PEGA domain protein [Lacunisphaera limnophila]